jgi:fluoride exporter
LDLLKTSVDEPCRRRQETAMYHLLLVAVGGAVGASLRHLGNLAALRLLGPGFPWGTMAINIAGSLAMGIFIEVLARRFGGASNELRLFVATGILGGFTTFSAFSLDVAVLWERGAALYALGYVLVSVVGAILALFLGLWLVRSLG